MKRWVLCAALVASVPEMGSAQLFKPEAKVPPAGALSAARKLSETVFQNLKQKKTEVIAEWIVAELAKNRDAASQITMKGEFKSKLDIVVGSAPVSPYGQLDGFDLIDEAYLPGRARYFRLVYITYHEAAPLVWEFRYYVKPDGAPALNFITWSEKNPFEYMSTPDMLLLQWYGR